MALTKVTSGVLDTLTGLTISAATPSIQLTDSDNNADAFIQGTDGNLRFFADDGQEASSSIITFAIDGTQRMRMASGGHLGINQNSAENHARLVTKPSSTSETCFQFNNNADARTWFYIVDGHYGYQGVEQIYANGGINRYFNNASGTTVGSIVVNSGGTAFNATSDYRLKDNPQALTSSGDFIDGLQPKTWTWNHGDGGTGVGFIAHEAAEVGLGLCVTGEKDAVSVDKVLNEETGEYEEQTTPTYQQLDYSSGELIGNIVAELQALRTRVATLETELDAAKARIETLENA